METPAIHLHVLPVVIPLAIHTLQADVQLLAEEGLEKASEEVRDLYKSVSEAMHIRRSGHFIDTMGVFETGDRWTRVVRSLAVYSGVIEVGWTERARGQESYPGRHPARKAVEQSGPFVESALLNALRQ